MQKHCVVKSRLEEGVHEFRNYLPSSGSNDIAALTAMEEEIKAFIEEWDGGKVPSAVPMLPTLQELSSAFYQKKGVQAKFHKLELPLALDKENNE